MRTKKNGNIGEDMKKAFKAFDADGDGYICIEELKQVMIRLVTYVSMN